jgi:hypothetical protein
MRLNNVANLTVIFALAKHADDRGALGAGVIGHFTN